MVVFSAKSVVTAPPTCWTVSVSGMTFVSLKPHDCALHEVAGIRCVSISARVMEALRKLYGTVQPT